MYERILVDVNSSGVDGMLLAYATVYSDEKGLIKTHSLIGNSLREIAGEIINIARKYDIYIIIINSSSYGASLFRVFIGSKAVMYYTNDRYEVILGGSDDKELYSDKNHNNELISNSLKEFRKEFEGFKTDVLKRLDGLTNTSEVKRDIYVNVNTPKATTFDLVNEVVKELKNKGSWGNI